MPVSPGTMCLRGVLVHSDTCNSVITSAPGPVDECSFTDYLCVNSAGQAQKGDATYYRTCVDGKLSAILPVPEGMVCSQGIITRTGLSTISPRICDGSRLIECQTSNGDAVTGSCSEFYALCGNGYCRSPCLCRRVQCVSMVRWSIPTSVLLSRRRILRSPLTSLLDPLTSLLGREMNARSRESRVRTLQDRIRAARPSITTPARTDISPP